MSAIFRHAHRNARGSRPKSVFCLLLCVLGLVMASCSFGGGPTVQVTPTVASFTPVGMPHAQGAQLVDANGHPFLLRGAQIESPFNYIKGWESGKRPTKTLDSTTFNAMVHDWHMNTLRLPVSNWLYAKYTADYIGELDQVIHDANAAGLFVVLDLHDNIKAGSPYTSKDSTLPKTEDATFWKAIAAHYKANPMVMYDLYNEPIESNWDTWLHGGGTTSDGATIVGFQDLVNAVRSTGSQQLIIVEPGSAGGKGNNGGSGNNQTTAAEEGGWATFPIDHAINDPNIMYSLHVYQNIVKPAATQSKKWGPILNRYPIYYGEWAFLTNAAGGAAHCQSLPTNGTDGDHVIETFLDYMASVHASWTAWEFAPHYLVQDYNSYSPTALPSTLVCGDVNANVGMGSVIKQYLTTNGG